MSNLEQGQVPDDFYTARDLLKERLKPVLSAFQHVIVHNVFTKHFNLPLTAALCQLLESGHIRGCLAWCHDLTWTSPHSSSKVFPGYPWDLLRTAQPNVKYVTVSGERRTELAELFHLPSNEIDVIYNGVDPCVWYGLTPKGWDLVRQLDLLSGDLILLMPVRMTQAKNIELAALVLAELKKLNCRPRLVVTGPPDPHKSDSMEYYRGLLNLREELGLKNEMHFVFEMGGDVDHPNLISQQVVTDLLRVSDVLFMPSHREGFGMPVLEAGLVGVPVVASHHVPAAREIGGKNVYLFNPQADAKKIAQLILKSTTEAPSCRFRKQVRQNFTWERIFQQKIEPYLTGKAV